MKIYEISFMNGDNPMYLKSKKELKKIEMELMNDDVLYQVEEFEFEYNLDSICELCSDIWR